MAKCIHFDTKIPYKNVYVLTAKYDHKSNNIKAKKIWKYVKFFVENMVLKFNKIKMWNVAFSTAATVDIS